MHRFIAAPVLLLSTAALSTVALSSEAHAGDRTPPGLERVCESVQPEVTTTEVLNSALEAITGPSCDHSSYPDGRCVVVRRAMASSSSSALGVEVLEPTPLVDGSDGPLYYARSFNLSETADPETQAVTVYANGKPLLEKKVLGEPLAIAGYLEWSEKTGWVQVVEAHGASLSFPVPEATTKPTEDSAILAVAEFSNTDGTSTTHYDLSIARAADEGGSDEAASGTIEIDLVVTFQEGAN